MSFYLYRRAWIASAQELTERLPEDFYARMVDRNYRALTEYLAEAKATNSSAVLDRLFARDYSFSTPAPSQKGYGLVQPEAAQINALWLAADGHTGHPHHGLFAANVRKSTLAALASWEPSSAELAIYQQGGLSARAHSHRTLQEYISPILDRLGAPVAAPAVPTSALPLPKIAAAPDR